MIANNQQATSQDVVSMYNEFPFPPDGWGPTTRNDFLTPAIGPTPGRILDAGCGTGEVAGYLANHYRTTQVVAIDLTPTSVNKAKSKYAHLQNLIIVERDITKDLSGLGRFDVIVSLGVLHHLPDPRIGLLRLTETLEPGGRIILYLYALYGRLSIERLRRLTSLLSGNENFEKQMLVARSLMSLDPMPLMRRLRRVVKHITGIRKDTEAIRDADQYLVPIAHNYTIPTLLKLIAGCGLHITRRLNYPGGLSDSSESVPNEMRDRFEGLPQEVRWEILELFQQPKAFVIECRPIKKH